MLHESFTLQCLCPLPNLHQLLKIVVLLHKHHRREHQMDLHQARLICLIVVSTIRIRCGMALLGALLSIGALSSKCGSLITFKQSIYQCSVSKKRNNQNIGEQVLF